ncbi:hypothetical protein DCS_07505 [Drechmeria coniospora]|uniref:Uncharacterized protein n=1 Tax=Drechmeria coniospora TaxID=98403 RepID=A0A151GEP5_DRECN|nr:hypothetical protein DCS_07505 [Drechmeria coniospora]KYK55542.1 hypothetical protein DCS_07505 [Drechmeria coniospora]ODA81849.1 hypothetical protein RJ55_00354 [Drechmeria coniospora]
MANGLDRLERLFTYKRKPSSTPTEQVSPVVQPTEPQFPSPSFIRPKTTRMAAREEVRLRQASGRSPSVPDISAALRMPLAQALRLGSSDGSYQQNDRHATSPSLSDKQAETLVSSLREFQFPQPPSRNAEDSPVSLSSDASTSDAPRLPSPRSRSPLRLSVPLSRLDTPPTSDPEDGTSSPQSLRNKALPELPYNKAPPTPDESPELGPRHGPHLRRSVSIDVINKAYIAALQNEPGDYFDQMSLQRSYSQSSVAPSVQYSTSSSTLREPDFNEFLNLSDDDIAESTLDSPDLSTLGESSPALPPMDLSISSSQPLTSSLLTLTPPRASRPAAVAAFEAARIARRYDFDLVYVVNLWPDNARCQMPASAKTAKPMMGRLLAAHGLHHVPSPLQISSLVHTSIMRSDGWIEYRNQEAQSQDLARGYACAFYTGQYARSSTSGKSSPVSGVRLSEKIDRGIVFAAYRKPRIGDDKLGRAFNEVALRELHREAEALVEMLIDIHVANRLRQPPTQPSVADETGPMPSQQQEMS